MLLEVLWCSNPHKFLLMSIHLILYYLILLIWTDLVNFILIHERREMQTLIFIFKMSPWKNVLENYKVRPLLSFLFHLIKNERFLAKDSLRASQMRPDSRLPRHLLIFKSLTDHFRSFRNQFETYSSVFIE